MNDKLPRRGGRRGERKYFTPWPKHPVSMVLSLFQARYA